MDRKSAIEILEVLLGEFHDKLKQLHDNKLVTRDARFPEVSDKIKVVIGMRRTGKTYFLYQHILSLLEQGIPLSRILYINFEDDRLFQLDRESLACLLEAFYSLSPQNHEQPCYLFLDEIQNVQDWPLVVRRFFDSKRVDIFLTGSSAKLLSKEIATSLRGRSLALEIWPYSFHEFMRAKKVSVKTEPFDKKALDQLRSYFNEYLNTGGFPEVVNYSYDIRQKTLQEYINLAVYRDVVERHAVKHTSAIKYMMFSMIHTVGSPFSINKFYNDLKTQGYSISKDILYEYAEHLEDAYLAFLAPVYDKSIRKSQTNPKKVYAIDTGVIRALTFNDSSDLGHLFENIVYLDLRRLGCKLYCYLTPERYEVDFLAQFPRGNKHLVQVAWDTSNADTMAREKRALRRAEEVLKAPGKIITLESYLRYGIGIKDVADKPFLPGGSE